MFNQFLIMYNSFKRIKSTLLESAFHALSKYMYRFFFRLMVEFIKTKLFMELKAIFLQNVLFKNLITYICLFFGHLNTIKKNKNSQLQSEFNGLSKCVFRIFFRVKTVSEQTQRKKKVTWSEQKRKDNDNTFYLNNKLNHG